ncbi:MAG TPA: hypothetical protein VK149_08425 [Sideroxyarcus sp.]|nr:hypothetical protein [Sideroxyarcus sp.]
MNKIIGSLFVASGLFAFATAASACEGMHHGSGDACPTGGKFIKEMDKNGDGTISKKEFDAFHGERFKELDANKDGKISADEMEAPHKMMMEKGRDIFEKRYDESDINHDGALSKDEAEIGMPMLFSRFDEADANKDGKVSKDEIREMFKQHREERGGKGMMRGKE